MCDPRSLLLNNLVLLDPALFLAVLLLAGVSSTIAGPRMLAHFSGEGRMAFGGVVASPANGQKLKKQQHGWSVFFVYVLEHLLERCAATPPNQRNLRFQHKTEEHKINDGCVFTGPKDDCYDFHSTC